MSTRHERPIHYVLDAAGEPLAIDDVRVWAQWFETADRRVAHDEIGSSSVSTIFLGLDYGFGMAARPILYETMIFDGAGDWPGGSWRYATRDEAIKGHELAVAELRRANAER